jgi:hypothetical protein
METLSSAVVQKLGLVIFSAWLLTIFVGAGFFRDERSHGIFTRHSTYRSGHFIFVEMMRCVI